MAESSKDLAEHGNANKTDVSLKTEEDIQLEIVSKAIDIILKRNELHKIGSHLPPKNNRFGITVLYKAGF
ncbi:MAG: hypothetical protein COU81_00320 [Candidatus Portnoybacteria bacterium CG10_big_fil_rev_8_21_14_0_10_36_7]|uniref:Uncharacterized protein n=1 Tax=Candidatus Portnoybacteria bacterium CG10_big_fil_rev_8_21_14_0_10_36_7 TaxID=1974812 RepID=A0A2M8KF17_9BACT|nr:MAG: hypothetical protein COU81_00320 [Candidatus Portnoybacteria bacterium CG10_big_fil_rev_8_21_14_0_10_36_7]